MALVGGPGPGGRGGALGAVAPRGRRPRPARAFVPIGQPGPRRGRQGVGVEACSRRLRQPVRLQAGGLRRGVRRRALDCAGSAFEEPPAARGAASRRSPPEGGHAPGAGRLGWRERRPARMVVSIPGALAQPDGVSPRAAPARRRPGRRAISPRPGCGRPNAPRRSPRDSSQGRRARRGARPPASLSRACAARGSPGGCRWRRRAGSPPRAARRPPRPWRPPRPPARAPPPTGCR